jgi:hypothetical protein
MPQARSAPIARHHPIVDDGIFELFEISSLSSKQQQCEIRNKRKQTETNG